MTADTGSPMAVTGMLFPILVAVQTASVMLSEPAGACALTPEEQINAPAPRNIQTREYFIAGLILLERRKFATAPQRPNTTSRYGVRLTTWFPHRTAVSA